MAVRPRFLIQVKGEVAASCSEGLRVRRKIDRSLLFGLLQGSRQHRVGTT